MRIAISRTFARRFTGALIALLVAAAVVQGEEPPPSQPIRTFFVTRSLDHDRLLPYLREARPDVVQIGNYGAMFHGYADDPKSTGWPMQLPVAGERAALDFQRRLNGQVHDLGLTVVGHFRLVKVMGNWQERTGFVEYYEKRWPRDLLGPKPHADLRELLQRDASGEPIQLGRSGSDQLPLCLSSPHARAMFKSMLKVAVDHGVDGVMTNFNYRSSCACPHCQKSFRAWLGQRLEPAQLETQLGITDLDRHVFASIPAEIPGYPAADAGELEWLAMQWGTEHFKLAFDEIFLDYGRTLKKDLIVGQWNHLGHVSLTEERALLPIETWGRGEDYLWYSGGAAFVGKNLNAGEGRYGDAWLSSLYVREMSGGKPFVMGKYERSRMAVSMAEGFATGGIGMGRYMRFEEPSGFETLTRYTNFVRFHPQLFDRSRSAAEVALVLPRQSVLQRRPESLATFRDLGQALVSRCVPLDVLVDERLSAERLNRYRAVVLPDVVVLSDEQLAMLRTYATDGGLVFVRGDVGTFDDDGGSRADHGIPGATMLVETTIEKAAASIVQRGASADGSRIDAPPSVRAAVYVQPERVVLHLVNYAREAEAPENNRTGPETERPAAVQNVPATLAVPPGRRVTAVRLFAPERDEPIAIDFEIDTGRVHFTIPGLLVYGVVAIETAASGDR